MKILFVHTYYPDVLRDFYSSHPGWERWDYQTHRQKLFDQWWGSADFYSRHLQPLGWKGEEVIVNDFNLQSKWAAATGLAISTVEPLWLDHVPESLKKLLGLQGWIKQVLFAQIEKFRPEVIYIHDLWVLNAADLKRLKKKVKLVAGQIASPIPPDTRALKQYGLLISSFPHYVEKFRQMGIASEYLKWCVEAAIPDQTGRRRTYDVVYVGSLSHLHRRGNRLLTQATRDIKVDFWGFGGKSLPAQSPIRKSYHGHAWGKAMYKIFAQAKIVVNRHIDLAGNYANNMRMFEATGMGALLLTEDRPNMGEFFKVGKEVVTYRNAADLVTKVKYYLTHEKERQLIAASGQVRTLRDHTYQVRMEELDKTLRRYI